MSRRLLLLATGWVCCAAAVAPPATAGDRDAEPPTVELKASGPEGLVGPRSEALAYFSTSPIAGGDPAGEYTKGSKVTFACTLDLRPIRCFAEYLETFTGGELLSLSLLRGGHERILPGPFDGYVPVPRHLAPGPHTITVVASDEDGTDPAPPTIGISFDTTPPTTPELIDPPPRRSHLHKPTFRFGSSDDVRLVRRRENIFTASLRRIRPRPLVYHEGSYSRAFETGLLRCSSLLSCTSLARAYYWGEGNGVSLGIRERLPAGLYELRVRARDAVGNKSPITTYRFRILPGPPRA